VDAARPPAWDTDATPGRWYAYFYLMKPDPEAVRRTAPEHAAYWNDLRLDSYTGGPFADRSGGLITFVARDYDQAQRIIDADPFGRAALLESLWLKEWTPTTA
jgi:uncharacterized protein YciI